METRTPVSTRPVRTRRRRALACKPCRQKKLRCDRQQPCGNCTRAKDKQKVCSYAEAPESVTGGRKARAPATRSPSPSYVAASDADADDHTPAAASDEAQHNGLSTTRPQWEFDSTQFSVVPGNQSVPEPPSPTNRLITNADQEPHPNLPPIEKQGNLSRVLGKISNPISSMMIKTRYMAPSSWLYSVLLVQHHSPLDDARETSRQLTGS